MHNQIHKPKHIQSYNVNIITHSKPNKQKPFTQSIKAKHLTVLKQQLSDTSKNTSKTSNSTNNKYTDNHKHQAPTVKQNDNRNPN